MLSCGHLLNPSLFCVLADRSTSRNNIANNDFVIAGCHPSLRISLMERRGEVVVVWLHIEFDGNNVRNRMSSSSRQCAVYEQQYQACVYHLRLI